VSNSVGEYSKLGMVKTMATPFDEIKDKSTKIGRYMWIWLTTQKDLAEVKLFLKV